MVNLSTNDHGIIDKNDSWLRHKIQKIFGYPKHVHAERKAMKMKLLKYKEIL